MSDDKVPVVSREEVAIVSNDLRDVAKDGWICASVGADILERLATDYEAAIARAEALEKALRLAMEWNWLDEDARPSLTAEICDAAIAAQKAGAA